MSEILEALTEKIASLNKAYAKPGTKICFEHGHTGLTEIPVPQTDVGRALLRALLVEIGRHEKDKLDTQYQAFETAAETEPESVVRKGDYGI